MFCELLEKEKNVHMWVVFFGGGRGGSNKHNWKIEITIKHGYDYVCKLK